MFDFDEIYALYPRKLGKLQGIRKCQYKIKSLKKFEELKQAVINYAKYVEGTEPQFIKHFSSFMSCWEDFIEMPEEEGFSIGKLRSVK